MPSHDPTPPSLQRTAEAWARYKKLMSWMAIVAVVAVLLALIYLKSSGGPVPIHMVIATIAGVFFTDLLGCGLFAAAFFSDKSGHDAAVARRVLPADDAPTDNPRG